MLNTFSGSVGQPVVRHTCIQDGTPGQTPIYPGVGNIDVDPLFADPDGADAIPGNVDDDFRLTTGSPCVDVGDNPAVPADSGDVDEDGNEVEQTPLDLDLQERFVLGNDATGSGVACSSTVVDIGAYELDICTSDTFGDMNDDGAKDGLDIQWFVDCVLGTSDLCICRRADFMAPEGVEINDVMPFVTCLLSDGGDCVSDQCPGTQQMMGGGGGPEGESIANPGSAGPVPDGSDPAPGGGDAAADDPASDGDGPAAAPPVYELTDAELAAWLTFFEWCGEQGWGFETSEEDILRAMADKLRELGIEVDGMEQYESDGE